MLCHVAVAVQIHLLSPHLAVQKSPWTAGLFPQTFLLRFHTQTLEYANLHSFNTPVFGPKRMFIRSVWLDLTTHTRLSSGVSGVPLLLSHHRALYVIRDWGRRAWSVWDSWDCFSTAIWSGRLTHTYRHSLCEPRLYMPPDQTSLKELLNRFRGSPCLFLSTFLFQGPRADQMAGHVLRVNGAFLHWMVLLYYN